MRLITTKELKKMFDSNEANVIALEMVTTNFSIFTKSAGDDFYLNEETSLLIWPTGHIFCSAYTKTVHEDMGSTEVEMRNADSTIFLTFVNTIV